MPTVIHSTMLDEEKQSVKEIVSTAIGRDTRATAVDDQVEMRWMDSRLQMDPRTRSLTICI